MTSVSLGAYNETDPTQSAFLNALSQAVGGNPGNQGVGSYNVPTQSWTSIASTYNLNPGNSNDQAAGAWIYAEQLFSSATGGQSLEAALQTGHFSQVQQALASGWPGVAGSQGAPQGLGSTLSSWFTNTPNSTTGTPTVSSSSAPSTSSTSGLANVPVIGSFLSGSADWFVRFGLLALGIIVVAITLWIMLSKTGIVTSPSKTFKAASKVVSGE